LQSNRPPSASTKAQKSQKNTTYADWQVREETVKKTKLGSSRTKAHSASSTQKMGASSKNVTQKTTGSNDRGRKSKSRSKSRTREVSTGTADSIRKRVQLQYNNYMETKEAQEEEPSLLEDSQATPPRPVK